MLEGSSFDATLTVDGRSVELMLATNDAATARRMLERARHAVASTPGWSRAAVHAIVDRLGEDTDPTSIEEAEADLVIDTIEIHPDGSVTLHLTDLCEEHFLDGYWPAVHLDVDDRIVNVTVEA